MRKIKNHVNIGKFLSTSGIWRNYAQFFHIYGRSHNEFNEQTPS